MALSDDQRAMLRLLARREEGYEDIAALMGLSVEQVREKVKEALAALDEGGMAPAGRSPSRPSPPPSTPAKPVEQAAERPQTPKPERSSRRPATADTKSSRPAPRSASSRGDGLRSKLPADRRVRIGALGALAAVVVLAVLLAAGVFGGGGSESETSATAGPSKTAKASFNSKQVTGAVLAPEDGGDAIGRAILGRAGKEPLLQIEAEGLEPTPRGETYTVWLYKSPGLVLRAGAVQVEKTGGIAAQFPLPVEVVEYIAAGVFNQIYLSRTADAAYKKEVATAKREKRLPRYTGTTVLRGQIEGPLLNVAKRQGR